MHGLMVVMKELSLYSCNDFTFLRYLREVSFFTGRGLPKIGEDQVLFLDQKEGSKIFKLKRGITFIF